MISNRFTDEDCFMLRQIVRGEVHSAVKEVVRKEIDDALMSALLKHAARLTHITTGSDDARMVEFVRVDIARALFAAARDVRDVCQEVGKKVALQLHGAAAKAEATP